VGSVGPYERPASPRSGTSTGTGADGDSPDKLELDPIGTPEKIKLSEPVEKLVPTGNS